MNESSDEDFGYDFSPDEEQLLAQLASASSVHSTVNHANGHQTASVIDSVPAKTISQPSTQHAANHQPLVPNEALLVAHGSIPATVHDTTITYPNLTRALEDLEKQNLQNADEEITEPQSEDEFDDGRSPIQRFRSFPRRPLTVSDLTAGAWCEIQYWYTLTKLPGGRRTRTAAMKQGSKVHQKLEDEVHTTVRVEVTSKEDAFGLRLWNLVQGLRTLRDTGLTRELEVWGMVNGNLVNGVIDALSYENPNPEFEHELDERETDTKKSQAKVTDFFATDKPKQTNADPRRVYLTDVKTRGSRAPVSKAIIRPAKIQLLLYHRFLSDMADGQLDYLKVMRRYRLRPDEPFSDNFLAQIGSLHDEIFDFSSPNSSAQQQEYGQSSNTVNSSMDTSNTTSQLLSTPDIVKYGSLRELLDLVRDEMKLTFPNGAASVGQMLRVQYVHRDDGQVLDVHDFPVSVGALDVYLEGYMKWWEGDRRAVGVEIEEAFKCRTCEFADGCSWRTQMDNERVRLARARARRRS